MNKVKFFRKAHIEDLLPTDEVLVKKVVTLEIEKFRKFEYGLLDDYDFIKENKEHMFIDENGVWNAILVTANEIDYGILVQSEGYDYARYAAFITKEGLGI